MGSQQAQYIPAGCIGISRNDRNIDLELWTLAKSRTWYRFARRDDMPVDAQDGITHASYLDHGLQASLLKLPKLSPYARLCRARWAELEFGLDPVDELQLAIIRVYLLPDDILRRSIDRSDAKLRKARSQILHHLDYSVKAWQGQKTPVETGSPVPYNTGANAAQEHQDVSLLKLFNTIPSPNPDPNAVLEPYTQDSLYGILESKVPGLVTNLYSYQRQSAALMLQKEAQPGQVLDPRLLHLRDTHGSAWYQDPVAGTVLSEPRYYDAVSGGILAEEMGSGKTIICLALILATRHLPTNPPEYYKAVDPPVRERPVSLADMAASCATRNAVNWKSYFEAARLQYGYEFSRCMEALQQNPGYYLLPAPEPRRGSRYQSLLGEPPPKVVYLSSATIVIVPNNLVAQWRQEIHKHTRGVNVLVLVKGESISPMDDFLTTYEIILFSQSRFEEATNDSGTDQAVLSSLHFKRCIVDEGHKLGNSKISNKSRLLAGLDSLNLSSRWIVTGTPSQGLFGVQNTKPDESHPNVGNHAQLKVGNGLNESSNELERNDLAHIGAMATLYLKARPWANTAVEDGDTLADWSTYVMLPRHRPKSQGRWECLQSTLNSLIIRHQLTEVSKLLPSVDEKVIILDGSYQDQLSLNVFSMMIVFNAVQSQRTDMDYFFHQKQRKALLRIVSNLRQASFFGGSFFTAAEIATSVETAEDFLREGKVPIGPEDEALLQEAIRFGRLAMNNTLRNLGNRTHEMAVCVTGFPGNAGQAWSLGGESEGDAVCTSTSMLLALQKLVHNVAGQPEGLNSLNGGLVLEGKLERRKLLQATKPRGNKESKSKGKGSETLAGNTKVGEDSPKKPRSHGVNGVEPNTSLKAESLPDCLDLTKITSTVSAKLTYLIDSILKYQEEEKTIVFYDNENVAWYLATMLDVLQIQHLIYDGGLTVERRAQYVNTFHHNPKFRVLLMDICQAAFGLDMRDASRIYFINPVLNPQIEAQAIGRVRRISQKKPVSVETLVLRNSIDEVILERRQHMTQAEHRKVQSILDIRPIYNWIKNARVSPMPKMEDGDFRTQMVELQTAQPVFGKGFGRTMGPDDGIILGEDHAPKHVVSVRRISPVAARPPKRSHDGGPGSEGTVSTNGQGHSSRPARRVRFAADSDSDED